MNFVRPSNAFGGTSEALALEPRPRKWPISYSSVGVLAIVCDVTTILICGVASGVFYNFESFGTEGDPVLYFAAATVVAVLFASLLKSRGLYSPADLLDLKSQFRDVATAWASVFLFLFGALFTLKAGANFSRVAILSFGVIGVVLLLIERLLFRLILIRGITRERFSGRNAVLITDNASAAAGKLVPNLLKYGFNLNHQFTLPALQGVEQQEEFVSEVIGHIRGSDIDEVIVSVDITRWAEWSKLISGLRILPLTVNLIPAGAASEILARPTHVLGNAVCIELQRGPLSGFERALKRTIDVVSACAGLVLLMPLLVLTAVMIKLDSPGPVFFRQRRCGFNGRPFNILKFRTMSVMEDGPDVPQAKQSDHRITRIGKLLRRSSIDELPQLLNVLNGTMSLIGPRPHALAHDNHFDKVVRNYAFRHHVKPGLTGWAQVNGHRGPTPTLAEIRRRVECDLYYIDNWSLRLDIGIILRTFIEVLRGRNAY
jgi:Undecaprenyl-phosphate glucose phosphotransferase